MPPHRYLLKRRIERARDLLRNSCPIAARSRTRVRFFGSESLHPSLPRVDGHESGCLASSTGVAAERLSALRSLPRADESSPPRSRERIPVPGSHRVRCRVQVARSGSEGRNDAVIVCSGVWPRNAAESARRLSVFDRLAEDDGLDRLRSADVKPASRGEPEDSSDLPCQLQPTGDADQHGIGERLVRSPARKRVSPIIASDWSVPAQYELAPEPAQHRLHLRIWRTHFQCGPQWRERAGRNRCSRMPSAGACDRPAPSADRS